MSQSDDSSTDLRALELKENKPKPMVEERRDGSNKRIRKPFTKPSLQSTISPYVQPIVSMALFFDPSKDMLWDKKPIWSPEMCFGDLDETNKSLLDDFRLSLAALQNASHSAQLVPSATNLQQLSSSNFSKATIKRITYETIEPRERNVSCESENTPIKLLKRSDNEASKLQFDNKIEQHKDLETEAVHWLKSFCQTLDFEHLEKAQRSIARTYYGVLEMANRESSSIPDSKSALLVKFANILEEHHQSKDCSSKPTETSKTNTKNTKKSASRGTSATSTINDVDMNSTTVINNQTELETKVKNFVSNRSPSAAEDKKPFAQAYEQFLHKIRNLHKQFLSKLSDVLNGLDQNVFLKRDQSSNRTRLLRGCTIKQLPECNEKKWNALRSFLYREFMTLGYVERIGFKSFKIISLCNDECMAGSTLHIPSLQFVRAAVVRRSKASPFEGLSSVCEDRTPLSRNLHLLCAYIRDKNKPRTPMIELRNLSKLYTIFQRIFFLTYDTIYNQGYRHGNPWRSARQQRWVFPEGIQDPFYDRDPALRLFNNLPQFVDKKDLQLFQFFFYWSGIRLMSFLGYKIIERLDIDQFDEQVQVAICGLTTAFKAGIADNVHLLQLSRFVIAITTICEKDGTDVDKKSFHTACRLLVEYLAVLIQHFNRLFSNNSLLSCIETNGLNDQMYAFLIPILILTHWMAHSPIFFEYETWKRRWASNVSFIADLWPEMSEFGNNLESVYKKGLFADISTTDSHENGYLIPELVNSFGISSVFDSVPSISTQSTTESSLDALFRVYITWKNLHLIANQGEYFTFKDGEFAGHSDEKRVLVPEPVYVDTPRLLPVSLKEIEDCINNRKKELESEQAQELAELINRAKCEAETITESNKVLVVVEPRYLVIDTNSFIDGLDTILNLMKEPGFKILVPSTVISELKGLRNRSLSPNDQDQENSKKVAQEAVRSLQMLEKIRRSNCQMLLCSGEVMSMDVAFHDVYEGTKPNNDRLIIEATRRFSESVCGQSIRIPRGDIWVFRKVLLVTRDRVMMLLANDYRIPSLDIFTFAEWSGFSIT
ncbi:Telomerase-binding protein EST1A-like protein [Aphelenchoides besseyi]|nr:Telomerase-binding protein EST1A-like protein [Aphelenchoides besseyi]KAI6201424.1 Telomerase-binding protein EST1A-like protein [Aphelenchoides besseyi]